MLYLNLLNRIFGPSKGVSKQELKDYQQNTPGLDKNEIERAALSDDFEREAFEGWENQDATKVMENLDQRFAKQHKVGNTKWVLSISMAAALLTVFFIFINTEEKENPIAHNTTPELSTGENNSMPQEKVTDPIVESSIPEEEKEIAALQPKELEKAIDRTEIVELRKGNTTQKEEIEQALILIDELPVKTISGEDQEPQTLKYALKKEIYLYDLKLVDYRPYRIEKMKETKMVMSGTPANQEGSAQSSDDLYDYQEVDVPYIEYLEKTMYYFSKGMYKKALVRFNKILEHYPEDVNAKFYGGLCYYNLNDGKKALTYFEKAYNPAYGNFKEEAEWLSYLTYVDMKQSTKAQHLLQKIANQGGFYSERAKSLLQ